MSVSPRGWLDLLAVMAGGGLGAGARFLLGLLVQARAGLRFPIGTLTVNVLGCLFFGYLVAYFNGRPEQLRLQLFLTTGLLGGFTTFSTFGHETAELLRQQQPGAAALNAGLSLGLCLLATFAGGWLQSRG
jgi:CrcB protein